jgi:hypothetical protein
MYKKHHEYINTSQDGLIITVEHNLEGLYPVLSLFEPINLTDMKSVPLYDSRITSIESRGPNVTQVTFNSNFEGYIDLIQIENKRNTVEDRLTSLEISVGQIKEQQKQLVSSFQWRQMNNYFEEKVVTNEESIVAAEKEIDSLKADLDSL